MPYFSFSPMNTRGFSIIKKKREVKILMIIVNNHMRFRDRDLHTHTNKMINKITVG